MKIIFAHGKEGHPNGRKATYLREEFDAITPDFQGMPLEERVAIIKEQVLKYPDCLLIGSSMGGAACAVASYEVPPKKMLLLAPALHYPECRAGIPTGIETIIIHGREDKITPFADSEKASKQDNVTLIPVDDNHGLSGSQQLIIKTVKKLLD